MDKMSNGQDLLIVPLEHHEPENKLTHTPIYGYSSMAPTGYRQNIKAHVTK